MCLIEFPCSLFLSLPLTFFQDVLDLLHRISQYISGNMEAVRNAWASMSANQNNMLEPTELAAFLRCLVKGIAHREQHYLLMHIAGMARNAAYL